MKPNKKKITITPLSATFGTALAIAVLLLTGAGSGERNETGTYQLVIKEYATFVLNTKTGEVWIGDTIGKVKTMKLHSTLPSDN